MAGVGASNGGGGRKDPASFDESTEKIGLEELSVVPLTSPRHPANLYSYEQQSQPAFFAPTPSPSSQPHYPSQPNFSHTNPHAPTPPPQVEYLSDNPPPAHHYSPNSTPPSSPPTSSNPILQNSTPYLAGAVPPRRPSETSSANSHAPVSASGAAAAAGGVSLGRVVSVTRKNRKPVPVLAPEDEEDAYDGLAYDDPAPPLPRPSSVATSGGGEWEGAKQMRVMGVDMPLEGAGGR
ncbi:hypothetical protein BDY24DRAFT_383879 [Mrakia frigida]|uniref:uncharacterized protein n=1 Tax=Mrakia frigida TaxID=29902 RepID=UPI003FCBF283